LIHEELGFTPVDENIEVSRHGQSISFEYILEKNPDYLFVIDRSAVVGNSDINARQTIENDLVRKTDAYKNGRIVYLNPNYWYLSGGGLVSVSEMMQQILVSLQ
jgi:iron complex transport system substrate-binding protein